MKEKFDALVEHLLAGHIFLEEAIEVLEKQMIRRALEATGGHQCDASKLLGIHRNTLLRKMVAYGLVNGRGRPPGKPPARDGSRRRRKTGVA